MPLRGWLRRKIVEAQKNIQAEGAFAGEIDRFQIGTARGIVVLPSIKKISDVDIKYELIPPFAYARVRWDEENKNLRYEVVEPKLNDRQEKIYEIIEAGLAKTLEVEMEAMSQEKLLNYVKEKTKTVIREYEVDLEAGDVTKILYRLYVNFVGLNELEPLMHDRFIEDIGCDGMGIPVYAVHKKYGSIKTSIVFENSDYLKNLVIKLAERSGRYISYAEPLLDGTLPDGSRVQATLAEDVTTRGPTFSIRRFRAVPYSAVDLIKLGTANSEMFAYLWYLVEHQKNIMVVGGTGAGKTSFLNSLIEFIPPEDKIVSIEDTRELNVPHQNWIAAVTRSGFGTPGATGKKYGEVTMFDLLRESFRQNPDYVIVGEIRGAEASVLFQGMASGHPSFGTMHAGSVEEIIHRLTTPPINLSPSLVNALDLVVVVGHVTQYGQSARRIKKITEIQNIDPSGKAITVDSFEYHPLSDDHVSSHKPILESISAEFGIPINEIELEIERRKQVLEWLLKHNMVSFDEVAKHISMYYKEKDNTLKMMKIK